MFRLNSSTNQGSLNASEWDMVRMHAQIGHDILCPINFHFPIHKIVLQHHERIDGTGYPAGLKGPEMVVEAKIIAVADVAEAIGHHRPYRPAKGFEEMITELRDNRGVKYDEQIADVALTLLLDQGFQFS